MMGIEDRPEVDIRQSLVTLDIDARLVGLEHIIPLLVTSSDGTVSYTFERP